MSVWLNSTYALLGLALGLAGFVWLSQKRFESAIYIIIFLLPLYLLKIKIFFIPTNVLEILIGLLFLTWFFKKKYKNINLENIKKISLPALIVLIGTIFSALFSQNLNISAGILKSWFVAPLILALIIVGEIKTGEQIKKMFRWLAYSCGLVAAVALFYFLTGRLTFDGRLAAFFLSPNHLAMYLAPGFLPSLALLESGPKKERLFFLVILIVSGLALYLTFSYAAWLAVILAAIFWIFARAKNKKRALIICGLLLIALAGFLSLLQLNSEKLNNFLYSDRSSWQSRIMIWRAAWQIIRDHPVLGIGPGMFQDYYLRYQSYFLTPYLEWTAPQPHNLFLAFWLETGLLGLAGFIWLLAIFFKKLFGLLKKSNYFAATLIMLMGYILIHGLADTTYFKNDLAVVFWLAVALGISLPNVERKIETIKSL